MDPARLAAASAFDVDRHLPPPPSVARTPALLVTANVGLADAVRTIRRDRPDLPFDEVVHLEYSCVDDRLPHGVPWSAFPVLVDPRCEFHPAAVQGKVRRYDVSGESSKPRGGTLIRNFDLLVERTTDVFLVVGPGPAGRTATHTPDETAYRLLSAVKASCRTTPRITAFTADDGGYSVEAAPASARARFLASYALNFRILAGRAYDEVAKRFDIPSLSYARYPSLDDYWTAHAAGHPLFLQVLYAIRRGNLVEDDGEDLWIRSLSSYGGEEPSFSWRGTGKHPSYVTRYKVFNTLQRQILRLRLVADDGTGSKFARLSPAGERFLDHLHPDCDDPDILCRWIGMGDEEIGDAMDAYVVRFFSKLKNRVDRLPARSEQAL